MEMIIQPHYDIFQHSKNGRLFPDAISNTQKSNLKNNYAQKNNSAGTNVCGVVQCIFVRRATSVTTLKKSTRHHGIRVSKPRNEESVEPKANSTVRKEPGEYLLFRKRTPIPSLREGLLARGSSERGLGETCALNNSRGP
jgi:hypothetical protein